jgi:hypothetical protein
MNGECNHTKNNSWWELDRMDIPLVKVCDKCIRERLKKFHAAVLTDEQRELMGFETDLEYCDVVEEQIEPEEC